MLNVFRFKHDYFASKLSDVVKFPLDDFDVAPFTEKKNRNDCNNNYNNNDNNSNEAAEHKILYDLVGVVSHSGSAFGGHYVAYTRNMETNKWYHCNDRCD